MKPFITSIRSIGLLTIALTVALAANFAYGQWANPPVPAPNQNVTAPVNVGDADQEKTGNFAAWNISAQLMKSPWYCDENGAGEDTIPGTFDDDCLKSSEMGAGGGDGRTGGSGILGYMRSQGHAFPPPPENMSDWPDWVYCGRGVMPFRAASGNNVVYGGWPIGDNYVARVNFNGMGRLTYNNTYGSCGGQYIQNICAAGRCGFDGGGAPSMPAGTVCNAYGCALDPGDLMVCDAYGCTKADGGDG